MIFQNDIDEGNWLKLFVSHVQLSAVLLTDALTDAFGEGENHANLIATGCM